MINITLGDFRLNSTEINKLISEVIDKDIASSEYPLAKCQQRPIARFPGRNTWYLKKRIKRFFFNISKMITLFDNDTKIPASEVFEFGYSIIGWDIEWKMNFDLHAQSKNIQKKWKSNTCDSSNLENRFVNFNLDSIENIGKDRLVDSWNDVKDKITSIKSKHIVLLMHDRAFRKGFAKYDPVQYLTFEVDMNGNSEADKLKDLINYLKGHGAKFRTLDYY